MDGARPRYDRARIEEMCVELREVERERRVGLNTHAGRIKANREAMVALRKGPDHVTLTDDTTFMMVVRSEVAGGTPKDWVLDEALRRLSNRTLRPDSLLRLALFDPRWAIRLFDALAESTGEGRFASEILRVASQKLDWDLRKGHDDEGFLIVLDGIEYRAKGPGKDGGKASTVCAMIRGVLSGRHPSIWTAPKDGAVFDLEDETVHQALG